MRVEGSKYWVAMKGPNLIWEIRIYGIVYSIIRYGIIWVAVKGLTLSYQNQ